VHLATAPRLNGTLAVLIPGGREGDLAGLNLFTSTVLSWAPPLIITAFNEQGMLSTGLLVLPLCWVLGLILLHSIDMGAGVEAVQASLEKRQRCEFEKTAPPPALAGEQLKEMVMTRVPKGSMS